MWTAALAPGRPDARGCSAPSAQIRVPPTPAPFSMLASEPSASDPLPTLLRCLAPASSTTTLRGLHLLHTLVAAAWPCPPSWTTMPAVCTCNMDHPNATYISNRWNIWDIRLQSTCVWNICNIQIKQLQNEKNTYCNIRLKTAETFGTCCCSIYVKTVTP